MESEKWRSVGIVQYIAYRQPSQNAIPTSAKGLIDHRVRKVEHFIKPNDCAVSAWDSIYHCFVTIHCLSEIL